MKPDTGCRIQGKYMMDRSLVTKKYYLFQNLWQMVL